MTLFQVFQRESEITQEVTETSYALNYVTSYRELNFRELIVFQEKEHKSFKEKQKQDMKLLKQELDMMTKNSKKEEIRKRKEQKEIQLSEEVGTI